MSIEALMMFFLGKMRNAYNNLFMRRRGGDSLQGW